MQKQTNKQKYIFKSKHLVLVFRAKLLYFFLAEASKGIQAYLVIVWTSHFYRNKGRCGMPFTYAHIKNLLGKFQHPSINRQILALSYVVVVVKASWYFTEIFQIKISFDCKGEQNLQELIFIFGSLVHSNKNHIVPIRYLMSL